MTLVVARSVKGRIAIASDTRISEHGKPLPLTQGVMKSCCLPGYICVSFSGSPELAGKAFADFCRLFPTGPRFESAVEYFERSSAKTNNDYIVAFGSTANLISVKNGRRTQGLSKTHWIGDKDAYERFREYEHRARRRYEHGSSSNAALFADEMNNSPASDLYSVMRNVVADPDIDTVGGFVTVIGNRDIGFRHSVYSDVLLDWPKELTGKRELQYTDKFDFTASGENDRFSVSQISAGYYNMNIAAFYVLKGKLLYLFHGVDNGLADRCIVFRDIEPSSIASTLNEALGFDYRTLCCVMSSRNEFPLDMSMRKPGDGLSIPLFCEANTMPK